MPFRPLKAVLFDMDGTLTRPLLDFGQIRADMGLPPGIPILEALESMDPTSREHANAVLCAHERRAAELSTLNDGCHELLADLKQRNIPTALITRNSALCTSIVLAAHGLSFGTLVTREDPPYKPSPEPLRLALKRLGIPEVASVLMVGDGSHDIAAAHAAGIPSAWISHGQPLTFQPTPTYEYPTLLALHESIRSNLCP